MVSGTADHIHILNAPCGGGSCSGGLESLFFVGLGAIGGGSHARRGTPRSAYVRALRSNDIANQEEHHRETTSAEELRKLLEDSEFRTLSAFSNERMPPFQPGRRTSETPGSSTAPLTSATSSATMAPQPTVQLS